ncbi:MAG: site-2 protease family protein [Parcubacteria group bacterium]|nr:site-2 protease family protein [Parcubacteria group bacterium]
MLITIIGFIIILGFLVLVHEAGHFFAARLFRIAVLEFGIGFPPKVASRKKGNTVYSINAIPLGGFVKIKGEDGERGQEPDSFGSKPAWQRGLVIIAGVSMNVVAGWLLLIILFMAGAPVESGDPIEPQYMHNQSLVVVEVLKDSPAEEAGIAVGDAIVSANGVLFRDIASFQQFTSAQEIGAPFEVRYKRAGVEQAVVLESVMLPEADIDRGVIGVGLSEVGIARLPAHKAIVAGTIATGNYLDRIARAFGRIFQGLWQGQGVGDNLGGPLAIAVAADDAIELGLSHVIIFTAILSFNLAIINILPFPALDGGRLIFLAAEAIRRKPSRVEVEAWFHRVGFALLILLAVVITYRDIGRFGGRIWQAVVG